MKIAFVGKGGAGKSLLTGTICRHLARRGLPVLALDVDTVPGLAFSLGGPRDEARLPAELAERVPDKGWRVVKGAGAARLVDRYAGHAPDGVRFLELGKLPGRVEPTVTVAFRHVMERFRRPGWVVIADLAAGTRQPMFGWADFADVVIVVADASTKSLLTARRLRSLATHVVANKVRSDAELEAITSGVGPPLLGLVPYDEMLTEAGRAGVAPIDFAPAWPVVVAAERLAERLVEDTS